MRILIVGPFPPPVNGMSLANRMPIGGLKGRTHDVDAIDTKTVAKRDDVKNQGRLSFSRAFLRSFLLLEAVERFLN